VTEYYRYQDRLIGELLRRAGGGVTVLVSRSRLQDRRPEAGGSPPLHHGPAGGVAREEGVFILSGPGARHGRLDGHATLFDITPTILALVGLPVAADHAGAGPNGALDPDFLGRFPARAFHL